jgi:hypothetical protein
MVAPAIVAIATGGKAATASGAALSSGSTIIGANIDIAFLPIRNLRLLRSDDYGDSTNGNRALALSLSQEPGEGGSPRCAPRGAAR